MKSKPSLSIPRLSRHSLIWRLFGSVLLCILLLLVFNWLLNTFALVSYYRSVKARSVEQAFQQINTLYQTGEGDLSSLLENLNSNESISTLIWTGNGVLDDFHGGQVPDMPGSSYENGSYSIAIITDSRLNTKFITLMGRLQNGYVIQMRTPMAAIEESVSINNNFLLLSGAVTLLISSVFVLFIARGFTRPIQNLSNIAGNVAKLDFSGRYEGGGKDEIDALGNSINTMSAELERTISNLKTANVQLTTDNERQAQQNEARRAFISNISHELKTPISLIQTYAEGLKEDIAADAGNREYYCSVIEDEAQKMSEMIRRMTMLMQLEAGGEQLVIERFDVNELLRNLMLKNQIRFDQHAVEFRIPEAEPVFVWADAFLIETVLTNYINNALNHVSSGGYVKVWITPAGEKQVRICVYNTGNLIPEEDLPKIWESFYKVDKARTRAYGGTGIGLSVVAAIMKAHRKPYGVYNRTQPDGTTGVEFFIELDIR